MTESREVMNRHRRGRAIVEVHAIDRRIAVVVDRDNVRGLLHERRDPVAVVSDVQQHETVDALFRELLRAGVRSAAAAQVDRQHVVAESAASLFNSLDDRTLVQSTYYYSFYVLEALRKAGLADRYIEQLAPWRAMLALGLTTTAESPEPTRSDSHAWSAHPNYGRLATVLGIRPASPGFRSVRIAPSLGPLKLAAGRMPHPLGDIDVRLERSGELGLRGEVTLPPGLAGAFEWNGKTLQLRPGRQEVSF